MSILVVVRFVALLTAGLLAGIYFGDRGGITDARRKLPPSGFVAFQQAQLARFETFMPFLTIVSILSSVAWLIMTRPLWYGARFVFLAIASIAFIAAAAMTRAVNIPINRQVASWNAASPPVEAPAIWARWERVHTVRATLAVAGFVCELLALGASTVTLVG